MNKEFQHPDNSSTNSVTTRPDFPGAGAGECDHPDGDAIKLVGKGLTK